MHTKPLARLVPAVFALAQGACSGCGDEGPPRPALVALEVSPDVLLFLGAGAAQPLAVTGRFEDGTTADLTAASSGTTYAVAPEEVASVSADGLLTTGAPGNARLTVTNGEVTASLALGVLLEPVREVNPYDRTPDRVLLVPKPGADPARIAAAHGVTELAVEALSGLGLTIARLRVPPETSLEALLADLIADAEVDAAAPDVILRPEVTWNDPSATRGAGGQHGLYQIRADLAQELATGRGVKVAVVDSGLDLGHPELAGRVIAQHDFENDDADANNMTDGHGTHVAGIIGARTNDGLGIASVAPSSELIIVRSGSLGHSTWNVFRSIDFAVKSGADVINLSLGVALRTRDAELAQQVVYRFALNAATRRGIVVVAAAANDQQRGSLHSVPALLPNAIAVGAVDAEGVIADFSNLRPYVDVVAPGVDILSTYPREMGDRSGYARLPGTSMAAPHVTGVAALMLEVNSALSPCEVQAILERTATDLGAPGKDARYGSGLVDAYAAVRAAIDVKTHRDQVLGGSCDVAVVRGTEGAPVQRLSLDPDLAILGSAALNRAPVPWTRATSAVAGPSGELYVTAIGGAGGAGVYVIDRAGDVRAIATGEPFRQPEGIGLGRDGELYVVDREQKMLVLLGAGGHLEILHEGAPLQGPTGVAHTEVLDELVISDEVAKAAFSYRTGLRRFETLAADVNDLRDLASSPSSGIQLWAVAPLGTADKASMTIRKAQGGQVYSLPVDLPGSDDAYEGAAFDANGDLWVADAAAPGGRLLRFRLEDQLTGRSRDLDGLGSPVDAAPLGVRGKAVSPAELIFIEIPALFLSGPGAQGRLHARGKLSDDRSVDLDAVLERGEIALERQPAEIADVDPRGGVVARKAGAMRITVRYQGLHVFTHVYVGLERIALYHPVDAAGRFDPQGQRLAGGDFTVPRSTISSRVRVAGIFGDVVMDLSDPVTGSILYASNAMVVHTGKASSGPFISFEGPGSSMVGVFNGALGDEVKVTVEGTGGAGVSGLEATDASLTIHVGERRAVPATLRYSNGKSAPVDDPVSGVRYGSSAPAIAGVEPRNGVVTGVARGRATITLETAGASDTVEVEVLAANAPPDGTILSPSTDVMLRPDVPVRLQARAVDPDGTIRHAYWAFGGARPNAFGLDLGEVRFPLPGRYEVELLATDDQGAVDPTPDRRVITVLDRAVTLRALEIRGAEMPLAPGESRPLSVLGRFSDGSVQVLTDPASGTTYASSNGGVATVSTAGVLRGVAAGRARIVAENEGRSATATVTVELTRPPTLESISIASGAVRFRESGATFQLQVIGTYGDGAERDLTAPATGTAYAVADTSVATVTAGGLLTAVAPGQTTAGATNGGHSSSIAVRVDPAGAPMLSALEIADGDLAMAIRERRQIRVVARYQGGDAADVTLAASGIAYRSSDPSTVRVDADGMLEAVIRGKAQITASLGPRSDAIEVTVAKEAGVNYVRVGALSRTGGAPVALSDTKAMVTAAGPDGSFFGADDTVVLLQTLAVNPMAVPLTVGWLNGNAGVAVSELLAAIPSAGPDGRYQTGDDRIAVLSDLGNTNRVSHVGLPNLSGGISDLWPASASSGFLGTLGADGTRGTADDLVVHLGLGAAPQVRPVVVGGLAGFEASRPVARNDDGAFVFTAGPDGRAGNADDALVLTTATGLNMTRVTIGGMASSSASQPVVLSANAVLVGTMGADGRSATADDRVVLVRGFGAQVEAVTFETAGLFSGPASQPVALSASRALVTTAGPDGRPHTADDAVVLLAGLDTARPRTFVLSVPGLGNRDQFRPVPIDEASAVVATSGPDLDEGTADDALVLLTDLDSNAPSVNQAITVGPLAGWDARPAFVSPTEVLLAGAGADLRFETADDTLVLVRGLGASNSIQTIPVPFLQASYDVSAPVVLGPARAVVATGGADGRVETADDAVAVVELDWRAVPAPLEPDDFVLPADASVVVTFTAWRARMRDAFWMIRPARQAVFTADAGALGRTFALGRYPAGTRLTFGIATPQGYLYATDRALNPDGADHVVKRQLGPRRWQLGFEDILGLGDRDYDDLMVEIELRD